MKLAVVRTAAEKLWSYARTPVAQTGGLGLLTGFYLLTLAHFWFATLGSSFPVSLVFVATLTLGATVAWSTRVSELRSVTLTDSLLHLGIALVMLALPFAYRLGVQAFSVVDIQLMAQAWSLMLLLLPLGLLTVTLPVSWLLRQPLTGGFHSGQPHWSSFALGTGVGLLSGILFLAPWLGAQNLISLAALCSVGVFFRLLIVWYRQTETETPAVVETPTASWSERLTLTAATLVTGSVAVVLLRALTQLTPASGLQVYSAAGLVLIGFAGGLRFGRRFSLRLSQAFVTCWAVVSLLLFPTLMHSVLTLSAELETLPLIIAARLLLNAIVLLPFAFAWGAMTRTATNAAVPQSDSLIGFAIGVCLTKGWLHTGGSPATAVITWAVLLLVLEIGLRVRSRSLPTATWGKLTWGAAMLLLLLSPFVSRFYNPGRSARLLFSSNIFAALRDGIDRSELEASDEGRLISLQEGDFGTLTLWQHRSAQWQIRESGMPKGIVSRQTAYTPHYSGDLLPAAVPLALHESPREVLLLGLGSGLPLSTTLSFPVMNVSCAEGDAGLLRLLKEDMWPNMNSNPAEDPRVNIWQVDPQVAVMAQSRKYDVIVSSPDQGLLMRSGGSHTEEFYQHVSRHLADDGIFCQRFQFRDYGAKPVQVMARTLRKSFEHVVMMEAAPGELLLLGTNSKQGLIRDGFEDRLQLPQVKHVLSEMGWDWSVVLNLAAYDDKAIEGFTKDQKVPVNSVNSGNFAFTLHAEVMKWGVKAYEVQHLLAQNRNSYLQWVADETNDVDLRERMQEVVGGQKLMTQFPDQPWAYRKSVKEQLTTRPKTYVEHVKGKKPRHALHPDEKRRMAYFQALSDALEDNPIQLEKVHKVAAFETPYDPLLTYFLHHEVADLYSRADKRDVHEELRHRLHAVYYSAGADRSVRDVVSALELIIDHPEVAEDQERYDHINSLLQMLKTRWAVRGVKQQVAEADVLLNDVEKSLQVIDDGLDVMRDLSKSLGVPLTDCDHRKSYMRTTLVQPLRSYRQYLLPYHYRKRAREQKSLPHEMYPTGEENLQPVAN